MSIKQLDQKIIEVNAGIIQHTEQLRRARHAEKELQRCCVSLERSVVTAEKAKSKLQHENEGLRQQIEDIRKQRSMFDKVYFEQETTQYRIQKDLELLLRDNKAFMEVDGDLEVSLAELEKEAEEEKMCFENELKELDTLIKHFTSKPRVQEQLLKSPSDIKFEAVKTLAQQLETKHQVVPLKKKPSSASFVIDELEEYLEYSEETVSRFTQLENENFNMFKYIENINLDIVKLESEKEKLSQRLEADKVTKLAADMSRMRKEAASRELSQASNDKLEEQTKLYQASCATLQVLKNGIHNILTRIGSASKVEHINDENIMEYLGLLEQRSSEVLHAYAALQADAMTSNNRKSTLQLPHLHLAGDKKSRHVVAKPKMYPNIQQEEIYNTDSDNDGDERPYTRVELLVAVTQQNASLKAI